MAKRVAVLVGMLAMMLAMAVPAMAQQRSEPVKFTGEIRSLPSSGGPPVFGITDEATGERYILDEGEGADHSLYEGRRVFIEGIPRSAAPGAPYNFLQVAVIRPLYGPPTSDGTGPLSGESATFSFELTVECEPPGNAEFLGFTSSESLVTTPLTDSDGDGVFTGSITQPKFPPGPRLPDQEPVSLPVRIVQGPPTGFTALGPEFRVIKDFGLVKVEDTTLSVSISFCDDGEGPGDSGSGSGGGSSSGSSSSGSGDGDGSATKATSKAGTESGGTEARSGAKELPKTGGAVLAVLGVGTLLVAGGLLTRRVNH